MIAVGLSIDACTCLSEMCFIKTNIVCNGMSAGTPSDLSAFTIPVVSIEKW